MSGAGKLRVALVDDEKPARDRLRRLLSEHDDLEVVGEAGDAASASALLDRELPDVCFLDIEMPGGDGFEALRGAKHQPEVVFTTAYEQYAVRAFEIDSLDYLLKPFGRKRLAEALDRARQRVAQATARAGPAPARPAEEARAPTRVPARRGPKIVLLDPAEIAWFEADEALVFARTLDGGRLLVERTLADLEAQLAPDFFRAHRQYLVNVSKIGEIVPHDAGTYRISMRDDARTALPLSRRQARRLREAIGW